jgi:hypothetical protein
MREPHLDPDQWEPGWEDRSNEQWKQYFRQKGWSEKRVERQVRLLRDKPFDPRYFERQRKKVMAAFVVIIIVFGAGLPALAFALAQAFPQAPPCKLSVAFDANASTKTHNAFTNTWDAVLIFRITQTSGSPPTGLNMGSWIVDQNGDSHDVGSRSYSISGSSPWSVRQEFTNLPYNPTSANAVAVCG